MYYNPGSRQQGMTLIEGLIAILIFSLGILSLVGLQSVMLKQSTDAKYRLDASFIANQVIGDMWAHRKSLDSFSSTDEAIAALPNGKRSVAVDGEKVTVTVSWQLPGESKPHSHIVVAWISG